jgi:hypothetical protein
MRLQKAHLRLETTYFDNMGGEYEETLCVVNPRVYEDVLHCLYGREYIITKHTDLYHAY